MTLSRGMRSESRHSDINLSIRLRHSCEIWGRKAKKTFFCRQLQEFLLTDPSFVQDLFSRLAASLPSGSASPRRKIAKSKRSRNETSPSSESLLLDDDTVPLKNRFSALDVERHPTENVRDASSQPLETRGTT